MYNWISDRKFSNQRSFPAYYLTPKSINNLIKNSFDSFNYNQLPVIKEEDGSMSEDEAESPASEKFLRNSLTRKKCPEKNNLYPSASKDAVESQERIKLGKTFTKLPPLVNINCLMNPEIKQSSQIWNTSFGKRLMQDKNENQSFDEDDVSAEKEISKEHTGKSSNGPLKLPSKRKFVTGQYGSNGGGDTSEVIQKKTIKKKVKKTVNSNQNSSKKICKDKESSKEDNKINKGKSSEKVIQFSKSKEKMLSKPKAKASLSKEESMEITSTSSSLSRNRRLLTECVKSILDNTPVQIECEHCKKQFENVEELCQHKKEHESKKENCLLCGKIFYNSNEFVQHLLSHEGVDQYSCKKCKKYFPNLKKYKQHCQDFHFTPDKNLSNLSSFDCESRLEFVRRWLPKFECHRCKLECTSEKELEEHKKNHIKMDFAGAFLLSPKNI